MAFEPEPGGDQLQPSGPEPGEESNRTFVLLALGLGGLFIVGLMGIGLYAFLLAPRQRAAREAANATAIAVNLTTTAELILRSSLATVTPQPLVSPIPSNTPLATATLVIGPTATNTLPPTNTQPAGTPTRAPTGTPTPLRTRTPTPFGGTPSLSETGFAEDIGLPGLFIGALGLVVIVFIVRRLRLSGA